MKTLRPASICLIRDVVVNSYGNLSFVFERIFWLRDESLEEPTPRAAKKPPVQAVQHVQALQVVESLRAKTLSDP